MLMKKKGLKKLMCKPVSKSGKKWLSIGLPLFLSSMQSHGACEYYLGVGVGPQFADYKQTSNVLTSIGGGTSPRVLQSQGFSARGGFVSLFGGTGFTFSSYDPCRENLYLGLELNADWRRLMFRNINREYVALNFTHTYYKLERDLGVSLLPGFLFSDCTLLYLRLGYVNGRFSSDTNDSSLQSLSSNLSGYRYGLGMKYSFNRCWGFRIEYDQMNYRRVTMFAIDNNVAKDTQILPRVDKFEIGLVYTF